MPQSKEIIEFDRKVGEPSGYGFYYKNGKPDFDGIKQFITDNFTPNSKLEKAILDEMMIARHEGQPTSRLTSLYSSLIIKK